MKVPLVILSHIALLLAGWMLGKSSQPASHPVAARAMQAKSERPGAKNGEARDLIREIERDLAERPIAPTSGATNEQKMRKSILAHLADLTLPNDPAATLREFFRTPDKSTDSTEAAAIFVLWAQHDLGAALAFAADRENFPSGRLPDTALELTGERMPPESLVALADLHHSITDPVQAGLARQVIASVSVEDLATMIDGLTGDLKNTLRFHITDQWPVDRLDDFGRLATLLDAPDIFWALDDDMPDEDKARWMLDFVNKHPDQEFAQRVRKNRTFLFLLRDSPGLLLSDRLDGAVKRGIPAYGRPVTARGAAMHFLANHDVSDFFHSGEGPDLRHAFHHGRIEARAILDRLSAKFPEYAADALLSSLLFKVLCAEDPARAAVLIEDLSPGDRTTAVCDAIRESMYDSRLETLAEALQLFPASGTEEIRAARADTWWAINDHGLEDYGSDYLRWIQTLPDSTDRELALQAVSRRIEGSSQWKVAEIREILADSPFADLE